LNARILTPAIYFPVLQWAEQNELELANDLETKAEWLDAVTKGRKQNKTARYIVHPDKDLNAGKDYGSVVLAEDKRFDYKDIDLLTGLPKSFNDSGKFRQEYPEKSPTAVIHGWGSGLYLSLGMEPSFADVVLGVRCIKIP